MAFRVACQVSAEVWVVIGPEPCRFQLALTRADAEGWDHTKCYDFESTILVRNNINFQMVRLKDEHIFKLETEYPNPSRLQIWNPLKNTAVMLCPHCPIPCGLAVHSISCQVSFHRLPSSRCRAPGFVVRLQMESETTGIRPNMIVIS